MVTSVQISCQPAGLNVLDGLGLGSCSPGSHGAVYSGLSGAKLSLVKCESCLPPCDDKKYEFKVCVLGLKMSTKLLGVIFLTMFAEGAYILYI